MQNNILKNLGYLLIWADFYLVLFAVHALFLGSITLGSYLQEYLQILGYLLEWVGSWNEITDALVAFVLGFPAFVFFLGRFIVTTTVGIWLVRRFG